MIASHLGLINVDLELAAKLHGNSPSQMGKNFLKVYSRLRSGLEEVTNDYDLVFIDCPPNFNIVTRAALVASEGYFIPAKPDYLSTLGIEQLNRHVSQLRDDYNYYQKTFGGGKVSAIDPRMLGLIFNMVTYRDLVPIQDQREHIAAMKRLQVPILVQRIRDNKRYYSRRTDDQLPLVMQTHSDKTFLKIRGELEGLATEVAGIAETI